MYKLFILILIIFLNGCASSKDEKSQAKMNQLELQESLQRFYTRFTEQLVESLISSKTILNDENLSEIALKQYLLYDSEALKIVTAPYPEINLLDMLVFIKLSKMSVKDYWIPKYLGKHGNRLLKAFEKSEKDINGIAAQVISRKQIYQVDKLVMAWRKKNPHVTRVEKIRLGEFSGYIEISKGSRKPKKTFAFTQLIVDTKGAISAVDNVSLISNRGIFLVQQMPFLIRLQTRILGLELVGDLFQRLGIKKRGGFNANSLMQAQEDIEPGIIGKLGYIVDSAYQAVQYTRNLSDLKTYSRKAFHREIWFLASVAILFVVIASSIWWGMAWMVKYRISKSIS